MTDKKASITITREARNGDYRDVIDAANLLRASYGSATNAIVHMVRSSPEYLALVRSKRLKRKSA